MIEARVVVKNDRAPTERIMVRAVRDGLRSAAIALQSETQRLLSGSSPSAAGSPPGNQTGTLQRSIGIGDVDQDTIAVGSNLPYAPVHENGAVITGSMTVPLTPEAKLMRRRNATLRSLDLTFIKRKGGRPPLLARINGGRAEFLFVLKRAITLPPRPFLGPAVRASDGKMQDAFTRAFQASVRRQSTEAR